MRNTEKRQERNMQENVMPGQTEVLYIWYGKIFSAEGRRDKQKVRRSLYGAVSESVSSRDGGGDGNLGGHRNRCQLCISSGWKYIGVYSLAGQGWKANHHIVTLRAFIDGVKCGVNKIAVKKAAEKIDCLFC